MTDNSKFLSKMQLLNVAWEGGEKSCASSMADEEYCLIYLVEYVCFLFLYTEGIFIFLQLRVLWHKHAVNSELQTTCYPCLLAFHS